MKYMQFIILLVVGLLLVITSGISIGSSSKLTTSKHQDVIKSAASISLSCGIIILIISAYTLYLAKTKGITGTVQTILSKTLQTILGLVILVSGIIIHSESSKLDESTEKLNIINSSTAIVAVGSALTGKLIIDIYNNSN